MKKQIEIGQFFVKTNGTVNGKILSRVISLSEDGQVKIEEDTTNHLEGVTLFNDKEQALNVACEFAKTHHEMKNTTFKDAETISVAVRKKIGNFKFETVEEKLVKI